MVKRNTTKNEIHDLYPPMFEVETIKNGNSETEYIRSLSDINNFIKKNVPKDVLITFRPFSNSK